MNHDFKISELERRVANLVLIGTVVSVRGDGFARVQSGGLETGWLPWLSSRMGARRDWAAVEPAEQVVVLCPNGDPAQGIILASLGSNANPNPSDNPRLFKTVFKDGSFFEMDLDSGAVTLSCSGTLTATADGDAEIAAGGDVDVAAAGSARVSAPAIELSGNVTITGTLNVSGLTALTTATVGGVTLQSPNTLF
jgi:phage baseplate assembly protein V